MGNRFLIMKCADWVLDLGPEGCDGGGVIVVTGTLEDIAKCDASHTGRYLKKIFAAEAVIK